MFETLWIDWTAWWSSVTPGFGFLLALPFAVVAVALLGDLLRRPRKVL